MIEYIEFDFAVTQANQRPLLRQNPSHSQGVWGPTWVIYWAFSASNDNKKQAQCVENTGFYTCFLSVFIDFLLVLLTF
ncbi:MAG: hypothetical protein IPP76_13130 [Moraxellaceae bacterium]|nr:hypothetical protein [Moraxellaceae bacterium]